MAKLEAKKDIQVCNCKTESKVLEGFKFGLGFYIAFLAGSVIVGGLSALIWMLLNI